MESRATIEQISACAFQRTNQMQSVYHQAVTIKFSLKILKFFHLNIFNEIIGFV